MQPLIPTTALLAVSLFACGAGDPAGSHCEQASDCLDGLECNLTTGFCEPSAVDTPDAGPVTDAASSDAQELDSGVELIDQWLPVTTIGAPQRRRGHSAVWTGTEMIVWGGLDAGGIDGLNNGGIYDPSDNSWRSLTTVDAPSRRHSHVAVWTGTEMIVSGGIGDSGVLSSGAKYNPLNDSWTPIEAAPAGRGQHAAVWTGDAMAVWGGWSGQVGQGQFPDDGWLYEPSSDSWSTLTSLGAPVGRSSPTAVWTGLEMIVWGGGFAPRQNTGGRYGPSPDVWNATTTTDAPMERADHTAVWTGIDMIVWGGLLGSELNSGAHYDPEIDAWTETPQSNAPVGRSLHTAVWTDTEMIVWGGGNGSQQYDSGGRYNPESKTWIPVSMIDAPLARQWHTAVWTGTEMIVWGGHNRDEPINVLQTGGRYVP